MEKVAQRYSPDQVRENVQRNFERLFAGHSAGRPPNWSCDIRTKEVITTANWLGEELQRIGLDPAGAKVQNAQFNRRVRSEEDLWSIASQILNDALDGNVDRNRRPHRRWG